MTLMKKQNKILLEARPTKESIDLYGMVCFTTQLDSFDSLYSSQRLVGIDQW